MQENSKANKDFNMKSLQELEEEESKDSQIQMTQPQDYVTDTGDSSKQAQISKISETFEQEIKETKQTFTRMKEINEELKELTKTYVKVVLERSDELAQLGQFAASKDFSKKILEFKEVVPPKDLEASIAKLKTEIE